MFRGLSVRFAGQDGRVQRAQAMVEYALILVLVAIVVIAVLILLGNGIKNTFQTIVNHLA
jgi:pilus assembly protein Flp/PilA